MPDSDRSQEQLRPELDHGLLESLERQQGAEVSKGRAHARVEARLKAFVRPGNSSEALRSKVQGIAADLSKSGCRLILPLPVGVGDVFRIEFDSREHRIPTSFARCVRCRLVQEDAFECAFSFFAPVDLPASLTQTTEDLRD